jgi:YVTN family beta-propeller protein
VHRSKILIGLLGLALVFSFVGCDEDGDEEEHLAVSKAVYIVNGAAETLSVLDVEASEITNDVMTVGSIPADLKIRGGRAYVVNYGDNSVQVIDLETLTDLDIINVGGGTGPEKIGFVGDDKAYVSCNSTNSVNVIDLAAGQVTGTIEVGVTPWGVAAAGEKVYVCNSNAVYDAAAGMMSYGDGTVSVIDSATDTVTKTIDVELNPTEIVVSGGKVLVLCTGNYFDVMGSLCVIDTTSDTVVQTVDLGTVPSSGLAVSPSGIAYITATEGLIPVDIDSGSVLAPLTAFAGGSGLAFDSAGNAYMCISDWTGGGGDKLLVMDASENLVGTYIPGGAAQFAAVRE